MGVAAAVGMQMAQRFTDRYALITVRQALQGVECELEIEPTGTSFIRPG